MKKLSDGNRHFGLTEKALSEPKGEEPIEFKSLIFKKNGKNDMLNIAGTAVAKWKVLKDHGCFEDLRGETKEISNSQRRKVRCPIVHS